MAMFNSCPKQLIKSEVTGNTAPEMDRKILCCLGCRFKALANLTWRWFIQQVPHSLIVPSGND